MSFLHSVQGSPWTPAATLDGKGKQYQCCPRCPGCPGYFFKLLRNFTGPRFTDACGQASSRPLSRIIYIPWTLWTPWTGSKIQGFFEAAVQGVQGCAPSPWTGRAVPFRPPRGVSV